MEFSFSKALTLIAIALQIFGSLVYLTQTHKIVTCVKTSGKFALSGKTWSRNACLAGFPHLLCLFGHADQVFSDNANYLCSLGLSDCSETYYS